MEPPELLWQPSIERQQRSALASLLTRLKAADYDQLWQTSVDPSTMGDFWRAVADEAGVPLGAGPAVVADPTAVPGSRFFPEARLNYAEVALRRRDDAVAVISRDDARGRRSVTWAELAGMVGSIQQGLAKVGVGLGDVVAGYLPNGVEALGVMLATAALGATWTCCAPETGPAGVLDRLTQAAPKVLVAVDGYGFGARQVDVRANAAEIRRSLPSLTASFMVPVLGLETPPGFTSAEALWAEVAEPSFASVPFDHPLYVLYSSGTTGAPKAIVHGHGGILLEHLKALRYHFDLDRGDRFFWFTTTGWMMWNFCVSGLLVGATVVLFDGQPTAARPDGLFALMAEEQVTCGGVGAAYLAACAKAGVRPCDDLDLSSLRTLGATGSPLSAQAARWVYAAVAADLALNSYSGGTDVCTGFAGGSPLHPVWAGELSVRCLGVALEVFDDQGRAVIGREGELVITAPMPSMPVGFLGDPDGARYRRTYFSTWPGVWVHGDRATLTERGSVVISGRSDGTLNRGGVRMGTAEFYALLDTVAGVEDALVVHLEDDQGGPGELWCFVVAGASAPEDLDDAVRAAIRTGLSPRHVPDQVVRIAAVPRTWSNKKLEVPVKRVLLGAALDEVVTRSSVANPEALEVFVELAQRRRVQATAS